MHWVIWSAVLTQFVSAITAIAFLNLAIKCRLFVTDLALSCLVIAWSHILLDLKTANVFCWGNSLNKHKLV